MEKNEENGTQVRHRQCGGTAAAGQRLLPSRGATPAVPGPVTPRGRGTEAQAGTSRAGAGLEPAPGAPGSSPAGPAAAGARPGPPHPEGRWGCPRRDDTRGRAEPAARRGEAARRRRLRTHRKSWSRPWLRLVKSTKPSMAAAAAVAEGRQ